MASLEEQLKGVKLKTSKKPQLDFSSPKTAGFLTQKEVAAYEQSVLDVNTELWLDVLKSETFPTRYCPITYEEAKLFIAIYERVYKKVDPTRAMEFDWREFLREQESIVILEIIGRLQLVLDTFTNSGYAFVKTSCRSAKDAPLYQEKFKSLFVKSLCKRSIEEQQDENVQLTCLLQVAFDALKVKRATEVMDMFCRSERVYQDMLLAIKVKDRYNEHFVIRKFVHIDVDMEFRGFVYKQHLTALSQYNYLIYSERLLKEKDAVLKKIEEFFESVVAPKWTRTGLPENYVIDFAVCDNGKKVWVIEINPFLETTDGAMFSWQRERHILEGKGAFEFRITERPRPGATAMLPRSARELVRNTINELFEET